MTTRLVHAKIVKDACDLYLEARAERIANARAELVEYFRVPYKRFWQLRWRHRTPSQAINAAKATDEWDLISVEGRFWARRAEAVRALCEIPGNDMIALDREDAGFLELWIERAIEG